MERVGRGRVGWPAAVAVQGVGWAARRAEPPASYSDVPTSKYCFEISLLTITTTVKNLCYGYRSGWIRVFSPIRIQTLENV